MALYLGNDEVSQRINLASVKGTNLPEISEETSGMFLSNDGENIAWSEVETTVDTVLNGWSLFDYKFSDHILEDESWTRSDSFDWKDGTVYTSAYEHLLADYNSGEEKYDYRASNINVIGELTNEKGVLSGFSASNYASMNTLTSFNNSVGSNPWEMVYKFNINELPSEGTVQSLIGGNGGTYIIDLLFNSNGTLRLALSSNGSSYDIFESSSSYAFDANKDYWVKLQFTRTQYILSYSENGEEYTTDLTIDSNAVLEPTDDLIYLGCRGNLGNPFAGSIDLNDCYIKINGLDWWEGADSIKYRLSADGHKVCDYVQENAIQNVYELNGVAWYYIIDTVNSKFKLPRSKWNFVGLRNEVGAFVNETLPNITGKQTNVMVGANGVKGGVFDSTSITGTSTTYGGTTSPAIDLNFDASRSSATYQDNAPVQQRATEMYLYFYVGDVVRNTSIINITQFGDRMIEVENTVANIESTVEQHMEEVNTTISEYKEEINTTVANIESSVGDKLDTTQITNCITEIPQDIKLELVDGILTLKAGSKVYNGNGLLKEITADTGSSQGTVSNKAFVFYEITRNTLVYFIESQVSSGIEFPESKQMFYNINDGLIYRFNQDGTSQEWSSDRGYSLPIAIVDMTNGVINSIDQVFNGFGYIGSTVFALPGVKGLAPNGRNADGSLKNIECTLSRVSTTDAYNSKYVLNNVGVAPASYTNYAEQEEQPSFVNGIWYQPNTNIIHRIANSNVMADSLLYAFDLTASGGKATDIKPKTPFRAVDHNDKKSIVNWFMPNYSKAIDVTFVPSGTWTAPSDGYVIGYCYKGGSFGLIVNEDRTFYIVRITNNVEDFNSFNAPVVGGQTYYMEGAGTHQFKFVPCRGI